MAFFQLSGKSVMMTSTTNDRETEMGRLAVYPATEKQLDFIRVLLSDRELPIDDPRIDTVRERVEDGTLDRELASEMITFLKALPKAAKGLPKPIYMPNRPEPEEYLAEGMYRRDGQIFRVHRSRETGRLYAKVMVWDMIFEDRPHFDYAKGAIYHLTSEDRMTLAEAKAWGLETGICCVCGAFLTDPKSVAEGIGPVCGKKV